jgi:hypothetical protein
VNKFDSTETGIKLGFHDLQAYKDISTKYQSINTINAAFAKKKNLDVIIIFNNLTSKSALNSIQISNKEPVEQEEVKGDSNSFKEEEEISERKLK